MSGLVRLLAEDWGRFTRALQSSFAFSGRRTLERARVQLVASPTPKFCLSSDEVSPAIVRDRARSKRPSAAPISASPRLSNGESRLMQTASPPRGAYWVMFQTVSRKPPSSLIARCLANRLAHGDDLKETVVRNQVSRNWTGKIKSALTKFAAAGVLSLCSAVSAVAGSYTQPGSTIGPPIGAPIPPGLLFSDWITQGSRTSPSRPPPGRQHPGPGLVDALDDCGGQAAVHCGAGHTRVVRRTRHFLLWPVRSLCRRDSWPGISARDGASATCSGTIPPSKAQFPAARTRSINASR